MDALTVDQLPVTATEIASWVIAAVAAAIVVVGAIVLLVSRRRRAAEASKAAAAPDGTAADAARDPQGDGEPGDARDA